jgi:hypothetical protein
MDVIRKENKAKLALEELATTRAIDPLIAEKSREVA